MLRYAIKRILIAIPILWVLSVIVFIAVRQIASPEDALAFNPRIDPEAKARFAEHLGLDDSAWEQYWRWLGNFVQGDLGESLIGGFEVWPRLQSALANTIVLILVAVTFSLIVGITVGIIAAWKQNSWFDYTSSGLAIFGLSIPVFVVGLLAQLLFAVWLTDWLGRDDAILPTAGLYTPGADGFDLEDRARHVALPALVLSVQLVAVYVRYMRASMLEVLNSDYLRTARSKGLTERRVMVKHGMRTALIPITTQAAIDMAALIGGLVVTEQIFQYPGMGTLFLNALGDGDYIILLPWLMITATAVMAMTLIADLLYAVLDPRIVYD